MRVAIVGLCLLVWASTAAAAPGLIVPPGTAVVAAPSDTAGAIAWLDAGIAVCVLDEASQPGNVQRRPGWLAVQLRGGEVGYAHIEAVDLSATSVEPICLDPGSPPAGAGPGAIRPVRVTPGAAGDRPDAPQGAPPRLSTSLLPGGFTPLHPARFTFGLDLGAAWLKDQAATQQKIGSVGPLIDMSAGLLIFDVFMISGSFGFTTPSDNDMFSQVVVPENGGDQMTADSSITVMRYALALGARTPFWALGSTDKGWVAAALFANFGWAGINARRSISNCRDCRVDELVLSGGSFWRVGVDLALPSRSPALAWGFSASWQRYLGDASLSQEFVIGLDCWWR